MTPSFTFNPLLKCHLTIEAFLTHPTGNHSVSTLLSCYLPLHVFSLQDLHAFVLSRVRLFVTPWIVAHQAPLSMRFPRQEFWSGLPFPSPGDLPDTGTEPSPFASPALAGGFFTIVPPGKPSTILTTP